MMRLDFCARDRQERGLDRQMRFLIDQAIEAGMVQVVSQGATALPGFIWDGKLHKLVGHDTRTEQQKAADQRRAFLAVRKRINAGTTKKAQQRRIEIAKLLAEGLQDDQIAAMRGEGVKATRQICRAIRAGRISATTGEVACP